MQIKVKKFHELNLDELYEMLALRSEVFVVEQDCVYQDIDGKDQKALHILGYKDGQLVAYTRCFNKGLYFEDASIGRVLVKEDQRKYGYGHVIFDASIKEVEERFQVNSIKISAQKYLTKFYENHDFKQIGEGYLEDGIPHIGMIRS
ncbi:ElaA protein [Gillisia sp. Hel_I_86]|uniref:GNAT family N-acetyltransferase n=1 Tax=Gillisia sp. Hel_I_86 TaxID=1249981 RepID=UPI00119BF28E|nr:GNAT family N-acetyltransferase [Gillisia sp. Hel_I_86]TVZ26324.1 ElaA protein [Gillisia sp. Hel_I_86]